MGDMYGETAKEKEEVFWRTFVSDSDSKGSFAPQEFGKMYKFWGTKTPPSGSDKALYKSFTDQFLWTTRGRMLFLAKG